MNDFLLSLSQNDAARNVVKTLGLPIPLPEELRRDTGPRTERPLDNRNVAVSVSPGSPASDVLAETLTEAGANPFVVNESQKEPFREPGEAYGRPPQTIDSDGSTTFQALVLDATGFDTTNDLDRLYDFFHPLLGRVEKSGRLLVVGLEPESVESHTDSAPQEALQGFVRSLSKEVGGNGQTANLLQVRKGAESSLAGPVRFILSDRSAYVNSQAITVDGRADHGVETPWRYPLDGKTALVTGAARGIGAQTSRILAREGADVICLDLPMDDGPVSKTAREINGDVLLCDITDDDAPQTVADEIESHGGLDILVNNAGITRDKTLKYMDRDYWDSVLGVNLDGARRITEKLVDDGLINENGRIICLSSISGIAGNKGQTNYAVSKAGLIGMVEGFADELAEDGIAINAIAPGFIETRLTEEMPLAVREVARRMNNLNQGGRPEDVGQLITFLATPGAAGVTGQVIRVCGGSIVGR
jgi:3-oxoacyl-[acyl-carrier protein] reductase